MSTEKELEDALTAIDHTLTKSKLPHRWVINHAGKNTGYYLIGNNLVRKEGNVCMNFDLRQSAVEVMRDPTGRAEVVTIGNNDNFIQFYNFG